MVENHVCLPNKNRESDGALENNLSLSRELSPACMVSPEAVPGLAIGHRLIALVAIISDDSTNGHEWISLLRSEMGHSSCML